MLSKGAKPSAITDTGFTPLALACESGNAEMVKLLLRKRADPNQTLKNGETPLMMAARTGNVPVLEALLSAGAKIEARETLRGTSALMWAAANANADAVRLLIRKGADIGARSATAAPGRKPYLAESGRFRIQEFIDGKGQGGTVVEVDSPDAKTRLAEERVVAERTLVELSQARCRWSQRQAVGRAHAAHLRGSRGQSRYGEGAGGGGRERRSDERVRLDAAARRHA